MAGPRDGPPPLPGCVCVWSPAGRRQDLSKKHASGMECSPRKTRESRVLSPPPLPGGGGWSPASGVAADASAVLAGPAASAGPAGCTDVRDVRDVRELICTRSRKPCKQ